VVISGCSGAGKSSLLAELANRGHQVIDEAGRRTVQLELADAGLALPWTDGEAFARRLLAIAAADLHAADPAGGWVFFDLAHAIGHPVPTGDPTLRAYHRQVFLAPPWPRIYVNDSERRHTFAAAAAEYDRLATAYADFGYPGCRCILSDLD
jgi:predicted ATPase